VKDIKIKFGEWCKEQDCSVSQLAGLLIHLDNYESKRDIAIVGWDLFLESEATNGSHEVSAVEAVWMRESLGLSRSYYDELRLRLLGRLTLPPTYKVAQKAKELDPTLKYHESVTLADLTECLRLTLGEQLSLRESYSSDVSFKMTWGLDVAFKLT
jgi:hypothetical protein